MTLQSSPDGTCEHLEFRQLRGRRPCDLSPLKFWISCTTYGFCVVALTAGLAAAADRGASPTPAAPPRPPRPLPMARWLPRRCTLDFCVLSRIFLRRSWTAATRCAVSTNQVAQTFAGKRQKWANSFSRTARQVVSALRRESATNDMCKSQIAPELFLLAGHILVPAPTFEPHVAALTTGP